MTLPEVTVIGAGIAGLTVALALRQRGAAVRVLEQADAVREIGAGLQISPNGAAVLWALGLGPALTLAGLTPLAVRLRDGLTDRQVLGMSLTARPWGRGFHLLHRADLIGLLRKAATDAGVTIELGAKLAEADLSGPCPSLRMLGGEKTDATLLIGADGLHSPVRRALNGLEAPFFTRQVAWRAVIAETAPVDPVVEVHMAPGRHLVSYPLRGGRLRNLVAVEERSRWAEESWSVTEEPDALRQAFAGFSPRVRGWLDRVDAPGLWGLFRHRVAPVWQRTLPQGAAVILGDAAHPTLPFLAQGANLALEDAWVLAGCLTQQATLAEALARFQAARMARSSAIVDAATANARAYHLSGITRSLAHLGLRVGSRIAPDLALSRYRWIYDHDVTQAEG